MKIAVAYQDGEVFQHFGETPYFKVVEIENGKVVKEEIHDNGENSHIALIGVLESLGVQALIVGGIGGGAFGFLEHDGIKIYSPVSGSADKAIEDFINGKLVEAKEPTHQCSCHH